MVVEIKNIAQERKGQKFGFYFALTTSLLIAVAIILTAFYSIKCMNMMMGDFKDASAAYDNYITTAVAKSFSKNEETENFDDLTNTVNLLKANGYVKYAYVYDLATGNVFWSADSDFLNKTEIEIQKKILTEKNKELHAIDRRIQSGNNEIVIGLFQNKVQSEGYRNIFDGLKLLVVLFLIVGLFMSALMSKLISKPLIDVAAGAQEFAKGNFKYRLKDTGFEEIDKLVEAYNHMSSQLYELYESLELKVEERTKELEQANIKLKETQTMMVHSEKMRSLGELVAGIAHEINNPINFIYGNIMILDNYQKDLVELIEKYTECEEQLGKEAEGALKEIHDFKQKIDMDFLKDDIGDLIKSCIEGVERTKNIILDLKNFSRMDEMVFSECNVSKEIDTTLNILNNKIKNRITIHRNYEENLPKIEAYGGQINQVFMNILDNAQSAIRDKGDIYITTKSLGDSIMIEFEDNGCGIKKENLTKIFEPFFTTKPVGQGTGLGMSIAYRVIQAHNGKINIESEVDKGTKISITLPIEHKNDEENKTKETKENVEGATKVNE